MKYYNHLKLLLEKANNSLFAFYDHPLVEQDDSIKTSYFTMLAAVAVYTDGFNKEKISFLNRLLNALGLPQELSELLRRSKQIDVVHMQTFIDYFRDQEYADNFIVDCIMMIFCSKVPDKEHWLYVAEFSELLDISQEHLEQLLRLVCAIVEQDSDLYQEFLRDKPQNIVSKNFTYYTRNFAQGILVNDPLLLKVVGHFAITENITYKQRTVVFEDCVVDINTNYKLTIDGCSKVIFRNCHVHNGRNIDILNCRQVMVDNCKFENFSNRTMFLDYCKDVTIVNSSFANSSNNARTTLFGGTLFFRDCPVVYVDNCNFTNCQACGLNSYTKAFASAIYATKESDEAKEPFSIKITNCGFTNCISDQGSVVEISGYIEGIVYDNLSYTKCNGQMVIN